MKSFLFYFLIVFSFKSFGQSTELKVFASSFIDQSQIIPDEVLLSSSNQLIRKLKSISLFNNKIEVFDLKTINNFEYNLVTLNNSYGNNNIQIKIPNEVRQRSLESRKSV